MSFSARSLCGSSTALSSPARPLHQGGQGFPLLPAVTAQQLDILDRNVEPGAPGVLEHQAFVGRSEHIDDFQSRESPDTVLDMDDELAGSERPRFSKEILRFAFPFRSTDQAVTKNVLFRDYRKPRNLEACLKWPDRGGARWMCGSGPKTGERGPRFPDPDLRADG